MKNLYPLLVIVLLCFLSCNSDDSTNPNPNECDFDTIINGEMYASAPSDELTINNLILEDNCLRINFSAGGCSGSTWKVKLIDSGGVGESNPPQRFLKLSLKNEEDCEAYITKELTFDITNLQVDGNQVILNITNSNESVLYQY
jgi:hypothetical protein